MQQRKRRGAFRSVQQCDTLRSLCCACSCHYVFFVLFYSSSGSFRRNVSTCNLYPLGYTASFLVLDFNNVSVAATSAADTVLFLSIPFRPVLVFLFACLLIERRLFEIRFSRKLPRWSVCRAMLNRGMSIAKVSEVVNVLWSKEGAGCKGMDWCISPLEHCQ